MADELVTLEQIKPELKIEADETEQDDYLKRLIVDARSVAEEYVKGDIVATWPSVTARQRVVAGRAISLMVQAWFLDDGDGKKMAAAYRLLKLIRIPRI